MKEYTLLAFCSILTTILLDRIFRTRIIARMEFWVFIAVMFGFMVIFNGYLTWRPIVMYGPQFFLNIRLGTIPLEDFLFGFSMITLVVVLWEFVRKHSPS